PGVKTESGYTESWVNPPRDDVEKEKFKESRLAPLVSMGDDGKLVYKPYSSKGDRILDFSTCGYMRSEVPIPDVPVVKTLTPPEGKARSTDNMNYRVGPDSYQDVQAALDEAAAMKPDEHGLRGAVVLQKGTWYFSNTLHVTSGVVLRGEGDDEDGTVLIFTFPEGGDVAIQLGGAKPNSVPEYPKIAGTLSKQTGADGETRYILTLDDGYWFVVKDPKFKPELKLEPFVGSKVILTMKAVPATSDLKHNMPYEAQRVEDGQEIPPLNPHLKLPELPFGMANTAESLIADDHVPSGSSTLTLEDASGFAAGDSVTVYKTTNWEWIDQLGLGERIRHIRGGKQGASKTPWTPQTYTHPRKITAINGNTITLDVNLPQSIDQEFGGGYVRQTKPSIDHSQCGLENLRIVSNYDETKSGNGKGTNYANLWNGIRLLCRDGWTRNCTVMHVVKSAVDINGRFCTVREVKSLQPVGPKAGGRRYAFNLSDNGMGNLCYKCYSEDSRHDFVAGARVMGPNVFLKCTAYKGGQSEPHHRWSTGILYDNITMKEGGSLAAINRGDSGTGHGWAGANIVFWNCAAKGIVVFDPE
ncbi:MAG TPA: hypothetical protein VJ904_00670, partial [Tichowtungia sp.]|nr:hypothetical protein [Tichowtungia sp.]